MDLKWGPTILLEVTKIDGCLIITISVDVQTYDDESLLIRFYISLGKLGKTSEGLCKEVGIHLYASRSTSKVGDLIETLAKRKSLWNLEVV